MANIPFSPDIPVGRLLANQENEIANYSKKLLIYELYPGRGDASYLSKALISRMYQHRNYQSLFTKTDSFNDSIVFTDTNKYNEFSLSTPTGSTLIKAMSECGMMSLMGHGGPTLIGCSGGVTGSEWRYIQPLTKYDNTKIGLKQEMENGFDFLDNENKPSVIYSLACDIIPFERIRDNNGKSPIKYNMGSGFTVAGLYGGVGMIGNTRTGYDGANIIMERQFGIEINNRNPIGIALRNSVMSTTDKYAQYTRALIGDPEFKIWMGEPLVSNVNINVNKNEVYVTGSDLENATLTLFNGIKSVGLYSIHSNSFKIYNAQDNEQSSDFLISIYKDNFLPYSELISFNSVLLDIKKD